MPLPALRPRAKSSTCKNKSASAELTTGGPHGAAPPPPPPPPKAEPGRPTPGASATRTARGPISVIGRDSLANHQEAFSYGKVNPVLLITTCTPAFGMRAHALGLEGICHLRALIKQAFACLDLS